MAREEEEQIPNTLTTSHYTAGLLWLLRDSQPNNSLFLLFSSGHGGQTEDLDDDEVDGQDEFICPVDFKTAGVIVDDELKALLCRLLPKGVREEIKLN